MKNELLPIQPGTKVHVSNGKPMPPARFNKKLAEWNSDNFDAVVVGEEAPGQYRPVAKYKLQKCGYLSGFMLIFTYAAADKVTVIEGAERYRVKHDGMDSIVSGVEA